MRLRALAAVLACTGGAVLAAQLPAAAAVPVVSSAEEAGFQGGLSSADAPCVSCWHFRYVQAQVTLPDVTGATDTAAFPGYGLSVRLTNAAESAVLGISTTPGSGSYSPAFNLERRPDGATLGGCLDTHSDFIPAGDTVRLELYFDGTHLQWTVIDTTDSAKNFSGSCTDPAAGDGFTQYQVGTEFGVTPWSSSAPALVHGAQRLAAFTNTVETNRTGERGSAGSAPWPVQQLRLTSSGQVRASTPFAWGSYKTAPDTKVRAGRNFSVWLPSMPS